MTLIRAIRRGCDCLLAIAVVCTVGVACITRGAHGLSPQSGAWIQTIEIYELPWDPDWEAAAQQVYPAFRRPASEVAERNVRGVRASAKRLMPLTVVRAWNGISRSELVLSFGRGQRATVDRLRMGRPLLVVIDQAKPGDDIQAVRHTVGSIRPSSNVPSDFVRLADAPQELAARGFGEVDSRAQREAVVIRAVKDPTPGSGALTLELAAPPSELGIDAAYHWYAEFKLFELGKDGSREREVRFEGPDSIVSVPTSRGMQPVSDPRDDSRTAARAMRARGRVAVKSPVPWGYEAVVVKWFGVAAKDRLVAGSGAKPAANRPLRESDAAAPAEPAEPLEETAPPALPDEPQTPDIPGIRL